MLLISDDARRALLMVVSNEAREPVNATTPAIRELLQGGYLEPERQRLVPHDEQSEWVCVTKDGHDAVSLHYSDNEHARARRGMTTI